MKKILWGGLDPRHILFTPSFVFGVFFSSPKTQTYEQIGSLVVWGLVVWDSKEYTPK